jgi:hypothetical protein
MSASAPNPQSYAALKAQLADGSSNDGPAPPASAPPSADQHYWRREAQKLDAMLETLWAGFLEAPTNGLPTHVADYVAAYTSATRLKMTLLGYSAFPGKGYRANLGGPAKSKIA